VKKKDFTTKDTKNTKNTKSHEIHFQRAFARNSLIFVFLLRALRALRALRVLRGKNFSFAPARENMRHHSKNTKKISARLRAQHIDLRVFRYVGANATGIRRGGFRHEQSDETAVRPLQARAVVAALAMIVSGFDGVGCSIETNGPAYCPMK
jgi:hypothetical protein